jgi:putative two-component system response regulator
VFDALTTKRPYKEAMPLPKAREYLEDKKEIEFDPACVDAFLSRWEDVASISTGHKMTLASLVTPGAAAAAPFIQQIAPTPTSNADLASTEA